MRNLIFDFDGTISDTFAHLFTIGRAIAPEFDINLDELDEKEKIKLQGMSIKELQKYFKIKFYQLPKLIKRAQQEYANLIGDMGIIEGMDVVLRELDKRDVSLGILTSNKVENAKQVLKKHNLEVFDYIYEAKRLGSKSKNLKMILKKHNLQKDETVYIGDEDRDVLAANKAGIKSAGVTWGLKTKEDLKEQDPDFIFEKPQDILNII